MQERNVAEVLAHPAVSIIGLIDAIIEQAHRFIVEAPNAELNESIEITR